MLPKLALGSRFQLPLSLCCITASFWYLYRLPFDGEYCLNTLSIFSAILFVSSSLVVKYFINALRNNLKMKSKMSKVRLLCQGELVFGDTMIDLILSLSRNQSKF